MASFINCRICLKPTDVKKLNLIYEKDGQLANEIFLVTGVQIIDMLYYKDRAYICDKCLQYLEIAVKFRSLCKKSDLMYRKITCNIEEKSWSKMSKNLLALQTEPSSLNEVMLTPHTVLDTDIKCEILESNQNQNPNDMDLSSEYPPITSPEQIVDEQPEVTTDISKEETPDKSAAKKQDSIYSEDSSEEETPESNKAFAQMDHVFVEPDATEQILETETPVVDLLEIKEAVNDDEKEPQNFRLPRYEDLSEEGKQQYAQSRTLAAKMENLQFDNPSFGYLSRLDKYLSIVESEVYKKIQIEEKGVKFVRCRLAKCTWRLKGGSSTREQEHYDQNHKNEYVYIDYHITESVVPFIWRIPLYYERHFQQFICLKTDIRFPYLIFEANKCNPKHLLKEVMFLPQREDMRRYLKNAAFDDQLAQKIRENVNKWKIFGDMTDSERKAVLKIKAEIISKNPDQTLRYRMGKLDLEKVLDKNMTQGLQVTENEGISELDNVTDEQLQELREKWKFENQSDEDEDDESAPAQKSSRDFRAEKRHQDYETPKCGPKKRKLYTEKSDEE